MKFFSRKNKEKNKNKSLKKKKEPIYEMELGELMLKASTEPAFRSVFYERLFDEKIIVLVLNNDIPTGRIDPNITPSIDLLTLPDGRVPVFTAPDKVFEKGFINSTMKYITISGEDFFTHNLDKVFVINPFSDYSKELRAEEIQKIVDGTVLFDTASTITISQEDQVEIGQPELYPGPILEALILQYRDYPEIESAYISILKYPNSHRTPNYIIAIKTDGNYNEISNETGFITEKYMLKEQIFQVMEITETSHFTEYFKMIPPFYRRGM